MLWPEFAEQTTVTGITPSIPGCMALLLAMPSLWFNWVVCQFSLLKWQKTN